MSIYTLNSIVKKNDKKNLIDISNVLNKKILNAKQISERGGEIFCENLDDRVLIGGNAVLYMKGTIDID